MNDMHATSLLTLESLWQFSLRYYSVREVKEACLCLQNQFHGNVNLLLLLKWLDEKQLTFPESAWATIASALAQTEDLIEHYRELRRKLKSHLPDTLYREALQFELQIEKQQQADLIACIHQLPMTTSSEIPLTTNYCQQLGASHLSQRFSSPVNIG
ncbi:MULTISPECIES: TIGR02444 family protein [Vibrio]|uniref:TIGR02444 family protein n=1 Tax=Vibrio TaxID=662 RepID=UPI000C16FF20|nr:MULTISPECIES: TIGR02444 family protein [Vibrio]NAW67876.1 TIGR02444 family protein [Vibrio sp. V28_P6S34P95]NAX05764.1 TIGR02444 family protein [Vibrio sp. V30_P3S12P165]NAX33305.1 TIGR02444 family protein [Vibrio sp. V29_P1S30P107]NAX36639.1 TIGR02444 family protein [Vibrio sp. V27_P1S3P104]NAX40199.1 TIGR02444 family protein [Vibrio sp. V26_P1S5P106]